MIVFSVIYNDNSLIIFPEFIEINSETFAYMSIRIKAAVVLAVSIGLICYKSSSDMRSRKITLF